MRSFIACSLFLLGTASAMELFESPFIDCPSPCTCFSSSSGDIFVNCEAPHFAGDRAIDFHMLPHNSTQIDVYRGSGLKVLPGRSFTPFRTLTKLEIRFSDLSVVDEMAFAGLRTLRVLNIQMNNIRTLPRNVFRQSLYLSELRLDENVIEDLPDGVFDQLLNLRVLDLSKNRLTNIRPGIFSGLTQLSELRLSHNRIIELDTPAFAPMINLLTLDLSGNQLKRIQGSVFANLSTITEVDLSSNQLSFVDPIVFKNVQPSLQRLYLCDNPWICDCPLLKLKRWIDQVKPQQTDSVGINFDKHPHQNNRLCRITCRLPSLVAGK